MTQGDKSISRNIMEIRFKNKNLNFMDYKGQMAETLIKKANFQNFKMFANRVDLMDEKETKIYFISWENVGFQLEGVTEDKKFNEEIKEFYSIISSFQKFEINGVTRIGTKATKLFHPKNKTLEDLRSTFTSIFFTGQNRFEKSGITITDNGIFALEISYKIYKANLTIGIMTKTEAIEKGFQHKSYEKFPAEHGIYFDLDLYNDKYTYSNFETLSNNIDEQIGALYDVQNQFFSEIIKELSNG